MKMKLTVLMLALGVFSLFTMTACSDVRYGHRHHGIGHGRGQHHHGIRDQRSQNEDNRQQIENGQQGQQQGQWYIDRSHQDSNGIEIETQAMMLATDYNISPASAEKIVGAIRGEISDSKLEDMGLASRDIKTLKSLKMPSNKAIKRIANALNEDSAKVKAMMLDFVADMKEQ